MAAAHLVGAQAQAMQDAANNQGGAFAGFMGMNMAQNTGGASAQQLFNMGAQQQPVPATEAPADSWKCACGHVNTGKFCMECGAKKPDATSGWKCTACGAVNKGKFCAECGAKKPAGANLYRCDKCGWEPKDPSAGTSSTTTTRAKPRKDARPSRQTGKGRASCCCGFSLRSVR
jgi:membrane protease subunit (stomatin/prohibitin family)